MSPSGGKMGVKVPSTPPLELQYPLFLDFYSPPPPPESDKKKQFTPLYVQCILYKLFFFILLYIMYIILNYIYIITLSLMTYIINYMYIL